LAVSDEKMRADRADRAQRALQKHLLEDRLAFEWTRFLKEQFDVPWSHSGIECELAATFDRASCLQYMINNGVRWDDDVRRRTVMFALESINQIKWNNIANNLTPVCLFCLKTHDLDCVKIALTNGRDDYDALEPDHPLRRPLPWVYSDSDDSDDDDGDDDDSDTEESDDELYVATMDVAWGSTDVCSLASAHCSAETFRLLHRVCTELRLLPETLKHARCLENFVHALDKGAPCDVNVCVHLAKCGKIDMLRALAERGHTAMLSDRVYRTGALKRSAELSYELMETVTTGRSISARVQNDKNGFSWKPMYDAALKEVRRRMRLDADADASAPCFPSNLSWSVRDCSASAERHLMSVMKDMTNASNVIRRRWLAYSYAPVHGRPGYERTFRTFLERIHGVN